MVTTLSRRLPPRGRTPHTRDPSEGIHRTNRVLDHDLVGCWRKQVLAGEQLWRGQDLVLTEGWR